MLLGILPVNYQYFISKVTLAIQFEVSIRSFLPFLSSSSPRSLFRAYQSSSATLHFNGVFCKTGNELNTITRNLVTFTESWAQLRFVLRVLNKDRVYSVTQKASTGSNLWWENQRGRKSLRRILSSSDPRRLPISVIRPT